MLRPCDGNALRPCDRFAARLCEADLLRPIDPSILHCLMSLTPPDLEILFEDFHFVAIAKPSGIAVHRSDLNNDRITCLGLLRDQIGQRVHPAHRLDRGTSGVLLFALDPESARRMHALFVERRVGKRYLAVVRGWLPEEEGLIDYPLLDRHKVDRIEAKTRFRRLATTEIDHPVGRYQTARYSLVEMDPLTGRTHQLRRHMAHLRHPIIGDAVHGDTKHNAFFREELGVPRLMLHATELWFEHPFTGEAVGIEAPQPEEFARLLERLGLLSSTDARR